MSEEATLGPDAGGGSTETGPLLDAAFQSRLAVLEFQLRRALPSTLRGDRRSPNRKGISLEFADYRGYVPGDDVRHLDWASYARLDQLIIKLYHDEEDVQLHLLLDDSRSMHTGRPRKARFARQVAAALAWIGLRHDQRVSVTRLGETVDGVPLSRGAGAMVPLLSKLEEPVEPGARSLVESCQEFMSRKRPRGAVVLISDLLDRAGVDRVLRELQRATTEITVLQILSPEEVEPELDGDLRLLDVETGHKVEVHLTDRIVTAYQERVRHFIAHAKEACRRRGAAFAQTTSGDSLEEFLLRALVRERVLR